MTNVEKEHVTYGIYTRQNQFKTENFANGVDNSHLRWTVDYREDFKFISEIYSVFKGFELEFTYEDVLNLLAKDFNLVNPIPGSRRNESLQQLKSQEEK
jgi:spore coat polysaccharide biosynthesis protein SpsF (cytidylyltransferase family)